MEVFEESGIRVEFPDQHWFRFEDCPAYKGELKGEGICEMDCAWWDASNNTLYLIELKDWGTNQLKEEIEGTWTAEEALPHKNKITLSRIRKLFDKSRDSASMLMSMLLERSPLGKSRLKACLPFALDRDTQIIMLSVINWADSDIGYIGMVREKYRKVFKPYAQLFGIKAFEVLTKTKAMSLYSWIK